ncbi:MAG: sugar phosphate isomerase/epimerase [Clostridia bacterium]|nr:sugar phosphate isomerase/epimerase [Clostridia bacterium]
MKNPVGIYYAYWEKEWNADFIPYIKKVKKLGFDVLEINAGSITEMTSAQRITLASAAKEEGIKLTYCIGLPAQYDVSSSDDSIRKNGIAFAKTMLDGIHEMGGDTLGGIVYATWPMQGVPHYDEKCRMRERSLASLREIAPLAEEYGISYCLEIVNRFEQCILNTAEEGVAYVKELGSPNVKLLLDTFHMNIEEDDIAAAIRSAKGVLGHFHMGECNRKTPGTGRMPWSDIFAALRDIDYQGAVVMEPFMKTGGQVGKDIRVFRDLSCGADEITMDRLAAQAAAFVKEQLV